MLYTFECIDNKGKTLKITATQLGLEIDGVTVLTKDLMMLTSRLNLIEGDKPGTIHTFGKFAIGRKENTFLVVVDAPWSYKVSCNYGVENETKIYPEFTHREEYEFAPPFAGFLAEKIGKLVYATPGPLMTVSTIQKE